MSKSKTDPFARTLGYLKRQKPAMLRLLEDLVNCESPSHDKASVDRCGEIVAREWKWRKAEVRSLQQKTRGNHIRAELTCGHPASAPQILVLGHIDTVYPLGTLRKMPFRISKGKAYGPGTFDMKGGLMLALFAVDALREMGAWPEKRLVFLWTSDEEIGSESSRAAIEREARKSDAVLVLEPALGPQGKLKTARKGIGGAEIVVTGRAAHAGIEPEKGVNAVHELAMQIQRLMKLNDPARGITVQATVISGGTVSNVVPAEARVQIDIRFTKLADAKKLETAIHSLRPMLKGAKVEVRGGINRPPLERTKGVEKLFRHAQEIMAQMRLKLDEAATGGGSDGNLTGALGIPTLDGLGAVGDGAHTPGEHVVINALAERAALLTWLLMTL
ncbi:MAG TPA: M20 family metallopeptidase [Candidatus Acidoferrales bacterium]